MDTPNRMTPKQLWLRIQKGRAAYDAVYAGLSEKQMTRRPGAQKDWSVKDQIAHLTWWENYALERTTLMLAGEETVKLKDFDAINAQVFAMNKDLALEEVLAAWRSNLPRFGALCRSLTETTLNVTRGKRRAPYWLLVTDTFEHYAEHEPDLERYVASLKKGK